eukprot:COSAG02_NODE_3363_length_6868_cov_6.452800_5_plen_86_part_00
MAARSHTRGSKQTRLLVRRGRAGRLSSRSDQRPQLLELPASYRLVSKLTPSLSQSVSQRTVHAILGFVLHVPGSTLQGSKIKIYR